MEMTFGEALRNYVKGYGTGISTKKFVSMVYRYLMSIASTEMREKIYILNDNYLVVDGTNYRFIRRSSKGYWEVKEC